MSTDVRGIIPFVSSPLLFSRFSFLSLTFLSIAWLWFSLHSSPFIWLPPPSPPPLFPYCYSCRFRVSLSTPEDFFTAVNKQDSNNLCTWVGELYLELHQGTFTTQAKIKAENRRGEFLLHDAEYMSTLAWALGGQHQGKMHSQNDHHSSSQSSLSRSWVHQPL